MEKKTSSFKNFTDTLLGIAHNHSLYQVFEDFLTMAICCFSFNSQTGVSFYEEEYLKTIGKYKKPYTDYFADALAHLVIEMEENIQNSLGNDVLGTFFETHLSNGRNGQFFTPFPVCMFMASCMSTDGTTNTGKPLTILDPACGSGRMLLASHRVQNFGSNYYYGIDVDQTCVKMTAINLFLHGMFHSEVMCANALVKDDFVISYKVSLLPFGIFKVMKKEESLLWRMQQNSFPVQEKKTLMSATIILDSTPFSDRSNNNGTQLDLF